MNDLKRSRSKPDIDLKPKKPKIEESSSSSDENDDLIDDHDPKKVVDDGDSDNYYRRLDRWQKRQKNDDALNKCDVIQGGLKVPSIIWEKLFNYQKVSLIFIENYSTF